MFTIDSNQTIRISKGDDSGDFSLFVNCGSEFEPVRHEFYYKIDCICPENVSANVNETVWENKVTETGTYSFWFKQNKWYLNEVEVSLADYGITVEDPSKLVNDTSIIILYHNFVEEIYFYIYEFNHESDDFLVQKIFTTEGKIITNSRFGPSRIEKNQKLINEDRDLLLRIDSQDTKCLDCDGYLYTVKAKLYDIENKKYFVNTLMKSARLYIFNVNG